ncbi:MAG: gamma-glutamylcyclotransferase family protein [Bacteroidia bacterium]
MFQYFGYGSNLNLISLKAKGVIPLDSEVGVLRGWKLKFNVKHWFRHEGGVGNIEPSNNPDDVVEGLLHECKDEELSSLDAMEAKGVGYDRIEVLVETKNGFKNAFTYVGLPAFIDNSCLPTTRYLNILIQGAEVSGLGTEYLNVLRNHPTHKMDDYPPFEFPSKPLTLFTTKTLAACPYLTAIAGAVFDMKGARKELESAASLFGGKDTTLFHLKRHDSSNGSETLEHIRNDQIHPSGKQYLNAYLHEYAREFVYVGRLVEEVI